MSLITWLGSANDLVNFQDAIFYNKNVILETISNMVQSLFGSIINTEIVEEHSRIISGFESKHSDEY